MAGPHTATMAAMLSSASDLARLFGGTLEGGGDRSAALRDITTDSREVVPGGAFVAVSGEREDGHAYVGHALSRGAALVVVRGDSGVADDTAALLTLRVDDTATALRAACTRRLIELGCDVVAITGSAGKTTVKEMCAAAMSRLRVAKTPGNLNTWTGIPLSVLRLQPPVDHFVAEVAMSAPGEIHMLAEMLQPRVGVLLNIGLAHVGLLGSIDAIADAKAELIQSLDAGGVAVCNADDSRVRDVAMRSPAPVEWFGLSHPDALFRASDIEVDGLRGTRCLLHGPDGDAQLRLHVVGEHAVLDACAAAAVAAQFGVGVVEVAERLGDVVAPEQRGAVLAGARGAVIYDDSYNSSPASLRAALDVLATSGMPRRIAVIGDMLELGDHAPAEHREAGQRIAVSATHLVAIGEYARDMADAAVAAGMLPGTVHVAADVDDATERALELCAADTAVLVKASHGVHLERIVERLRP
jgi:UDP-N-acetylmuramoyl-tripeptide--D-alanyl-D-alanine ligase